MGKTDDTSHSPVLPLQNFTLYNEYGEVMCGEMKGERIIIPFCCAFILQDNLFPSHKLHLAKIMSLNRKYQT